MYEFLVFDQAWRPEALHKHKTMLVAADKDKVTWSRAFAEIGRIGDKET